MPSLDKGLTITWAKKNYDVKDILKIKKEEGIKLTDYVCEAIRFFEKNKDNVNSNFDIKMIEELVDRRIKEYLDNSNEMAITINKENTINKLLHLEKVDDIYDFELEDD
ncbi:hypothetical protein [Clostridium baratii]|uniref:hypothetical protein n=1 Tax=Clostridium baratii TaxID=1561 RepID=UPI0030D41EF2